MISSSLFSSFHEVYLSNAAKDFTGVLWTVNVKNTIRVIGLTLLNDVIIIVLNFSRRMYLSNTHKDFIIGVQWSIQVKNTIDDTGLTLIN